MNDLNLILAAYEDAARSPGGTSIKAWAERYPEHAPALIEYAMTETFLNEETLLEDDVEGLEATFRARAATLRSRMEASARAAAPVSLLGAAKSKGLSAIALAKRLNVGITIVAKLERRLFHPAGIPRQLVSSLADALGTTAESITQYLKMPPTLSATANYRSAQAPKIDGQEAFLDAIESASDLTSDQKSHWRAAAADPLGE